MIRRAWLRLFAPALLFILLVSCQGGGYHPDAVQTQHPAFYVAPGGNDASDGSLQSPWATVNHAADVLQAGETVYIRAGRYSLSRQIRVRHSGNEAAWIIFAAYPEEAVVLDAGGIHVPPPSGQPPFAHDQGAFQLEDVAYVTVKGLTVINSYTSGFTVRNSHHIEILDNVSENSFAPGIGVWGGHHQKIIGNTVTNANDPRRGCNRGQTTVQAVLATVA